MAAQYQIIHRHKVIMRPLRIIDKMQIQLFVRIKDFAHRQPDIIGLNQKILFGALGAKQNINIAGIVLRFGGGTDHADKIPDHHDLFWQIIERR